MTFSTLSRGTVFGASHRDKLADAKSCYSFCTLTYFNMKFNFILLNLIFAVSDEFDQEDVYVNSAVPTVEKHKPTSGRL